MDALENKASGVETEAQAVQANVWFCGRLGANER